MSPLASVMVLAFLLLIVLALVVWALLMPLQGTARRDERRQDAPRLVRPDSAVTNDDVRGAKAATKRPEAPDDAFERFLRAGREDERG